MTLDEKIAKEKQAVEYEVTRIYYCSWIFLLFGIVCVFSGAYEMTDARRKAAFIYQEHQIPWGNKNFTNFTMANVTSPTMDRVEVQLFDHIWNMSLLTIVVSVFILAQGRAAMRSTQKQKSRIAQRMFRRHFFTFLLFLIFYVFTRKQSRSFKSIFESLKEGDKNQTAIVDDIASMNSTEVAEDQKRQLRARKHSHHQIVFENMEDGHDFNTMFEHHNQMRGADMMDDDFEKFFQNQLIPDDVKEMMRDRGMGGRKRAGQKKAHKKGRKNGRRFHEEPMDYEDEPEELEFDGRREAYRMFAPGLWKMAEEERMARHERHHGPMVRATKKDATADWPKMTAMCPVMLFFIFASIHQICRIKFLEKSLAKLEFLQKAKKLVKKSVQKQVTVQPVQAIVQAAQPVQVVAPMPVAQKKCKKVKKEQPQLVQQVFMPVVKKMTAKIEDVEAIPQVNESFDYSMTDPLVDDDIVFEEQSNTGVTSIKNSMA